MKTTTSIVCYDTPNRINYLATGRSIKTVCARVDPHLDTDRAAVVLNTQKPDAISTILNGLAHTFKLKKLKIDTLKRFVQEYDTGDQGMRSE